MRFTDAELDTFRRDVRSSERFCRLWKTLRWVALLLGLFSLALAVLQYNRVQDIAAQRSSISLDKNIAPDTAGIEKAINISIALLRWEFTTYIGMLVSGSTGGLLVVSSLIGWRYKLHPPSSIVLLRRLIESHEKSRPDT